MNFPFGVIKPTKRQDVKRVIWTQPCPTWHWHGPAPSPCTTGRIHDSTTPTQPYLCPLTLTELIHDVAVSAVCASVDRDRRRCLITPMGCATPCHNFDGTSLVTMSFITQCNHWSTCFPSWKMALVVVVLALRTSSTSLLCFSIVLCVSCLVLLLWQIVLVFQLWPRV